MKDTISEFHQILDKYKISHPIDAQAQDEIEKYKNVDFKRLLKKTGTYSFIFSIIASIFFGLKKIGINITIIKSTIIFTIGSLTIIAAISTGTYVVIKHATNNKSKQETREKIKNKIPADTNIDPQNKTIYMQKSDPGTKETKTVQQPEMSHRLGILPFAAENVPPALATAVSQVINNDLSLAKGTKRVINLDANRKQSSVGKLVIGSIELLDGKYTITAKVVDAKTSKILFYASKTVSSKGEILSASKNIAADLNAKIK